MMGSSRPSDPTVEAAAEVVALLRSLATGGVAAVATRIDKARTTALASIEDAHARLMETAATHEEAGRAIAARQVALDERAAKLDEDDRAQKTAWATLAEANRRHHDEAGKLATSQGIFDASQTELDERRQRLDDEHTARSRKLEESHTKRLADHKAYVDRITAELDKRESNAAQREADIAKTVDEHVTRCAALEEMEALAKAVSEDAEVLKVEYERKLAQLRSLVG